VVLMNRCIVTQEEIDDILRRYTADELLKDIARTHNMAVSTICDIARRNGLPKRAPRGKGFHKATG
jgi:hypothetical protein